VVNTSILKGKKAHCLSRLGQVELERPYFYNQAQGSGRYLLDEQLEVVGVRQSPQFQKQLLKLAACLAYQSAEELLRELSGLDVSDSRIWELTQKAGQQLEQGWQTQPTAPKQSEARDHLNVNSACPGPVAQEMERSRRKGVGMDGVMIHIRGEGYKETKLGTLFEVGMIETGDKDRPVQAKALNQQYLLYLGGRRSSDGD
jgi:hypothetical protein